jgi:hypothetical protein
MAQSFFFFLLLLLLLYSVASINNYGSKLVAHATAIQLFPLDDELVRKPRGAAPGRSEDEHDARRPSDSSVSTDERDGRLSPHRHTSRRGSDRDLSVSTEGRHGHRHFWTRKGDFANFVQHNVVAFKIYGFSLTPQAAGSLFVSLVGSLIIAIARDAL